jgi:hypothetical protein
MKRVYISPFTESMKMLAVTMLCGSGKNVGVNNEELGGTSEEPIIID